MNSHTGQSPSPTCCFRPVRSVVSNVESGSVESCFGFVGPSFKRSSDEPVGGFTSTSNGVSDKISVVGLDLASGFVHLFKVDDGDVW